MRYRYKRELKTTDYMYETLSNDEDLEKRREIQEDSDMRMEIQGRIRELKKLGYPKEEALKRLNSEFPDSQFKNFFQSWIENVYKAKNKTTFNDIGFGRFE